jgi:transposase
MTGPSSGTTSSPSSRISSRATTEGARRRIAEEERKKREAKEKREETKRKKRDTETPPKKKQKKEKKKKGPKVTGARRIRVFFRTAEQRRLLRRAFDTTRYVYNVCANEMNEGRPPTGKHLRSVAVNNDATARVGTEAEWKEIPYEVRDGAMHDAKKARKSTLARIESQAEKKDGREATPKERHAWKFKFRRKKDAIESFAILAKDLNRDDPNHFHRTLFGYRGYRGVLDSAEPLPLVFQNDVRLWHHKVLDAYYLIVPTTATWPETQRPTSQPKRPQAPPRRDRSTPKTDSEREAYRVYAQRKARWRDGRKRWKRNEKAAAAVPTVVAAASSTPSSPPAASKKAGIVSVDMGMRTFATCYDPVREVATKWGNGCTSRLWRLANEIQSLRGRMAAPWTNHRSRRHMRAAAFRMGLRLRNLVDEMHHKLALWLCANHETVIVGELHVKSCVTKRDFLGRWRRRISKQTVRKLYSLAHYRFRQYLLHVGERLGTCVVIADEAWTTKTCSGCGRIDPNVGASEVFGCRRCRLVIDRDVNAARNIWLKFIHDGKVRLDEDVGVQQLQQPVSDSGGRAVHPTGGLRQCQLQAFFPVTQ